MYLTFCIISLYVGITFDISTTSCILLAGNPVSPLSANRWIECKASPMAQSGELEIKASPPPHHGEPQRTRVVTSRCHRSPTPVELQGTRLRTHTTPTRRGGESSVHIHQLHRDRERSAQPATPSNMPSAIVIPPTPSNQQPPPVQPAQPLNTPSAIGYIPSAASEASMQPLHQENDASTQLAAPYNTVGYIPSAASAPPYYPQQFYPHYQGAPFLAPGYPQPDRKSTRLNSSHI